MINELKIFPGSTRTITEYGPKPCHILVGEGATLCYYQMGKFNEGVDTNSELIIDLAENAKFITAAVLLDEKDINLKITVNLNGKGAICESDAVYLGSKKQKYNLSLIANHNAAATTSKQNAKGVMTGNSEMNFDGLINIKNGIAKIDGDQLHQAILLSDKAKVKCSPELAICSEDVKCTHGSSIGMLDESGIFYMGSRGIPEKEAKELLVRAFIMQIISEIADEGTKQNFTNEVEKWLTKNL